MSLNIEFINAAKYREKEEKIGAIPALRSLLIAIGSRGGTLDIDDKPDAEGMLTGRFTDVNVVLLTKDKTEFAGSGGPLEVRGPDREAVKKNLFDAMLTPQADGQAVLSVGGNTMSGVGSRYFAIQ